MSNSAVNKRRLNALKNAAEALHERTRCTKGIRTGGS